MGRSYNPCEVSDRIYLKMTGHDIYKYAVKTVPFVVKQNLEKSGLELADVRKVLVHQANEKLDWAIIKRLFNLYNEKAIPAGIMPMIISWTGNSSVATLPTLLDLIARGQMNDYRLTPGDIIVFAAVGAGMNVNTMVYLVPA